MLLDILSKVSATRNPLDTSWYQPIKRTWQKGEATQFQKLPHCLREKGRQVRYLIVNIFI